MRQFANLNELAKSVGTVLGEGEWLTVTQEMINKFADATGDHQYIHVDPVRAAKGPFGAPVAHGFLTLSLLPQLASTAYKVGGIATGVNYGSNRVRFIEPVRVNSRIRAHVKLLAVEPGEKGTRVTNETTIQLEGSSRPALIAENIALLIPG